MQYILSAIKIIIIVILVLFAVFNRDMVEIVIIPDYIVYRTYLFIPILGALALGGMIMTLAFLKDKMHFSRSMKIMRQTLKNKEDELARLHNVSLMKDD
jgi:uncharacterized integral membrane protein